MISIIVAMDENRLIGSNNDLPWHLPADLKRVKQLTTGHAIILGRKNYQSIGKPLPDRLNIILSGDPNFQAPGCIVVDSIESAVHAAGDRDIFIFGGARVYQQMYALAQRMYLTLVHHKFDGDVYFPDYDAGDWVEMERQDFDPDEKNPYPYSFLVLERSQ